jgi:hypothetical protein
VFNPVISFSASRIHNSKHQHLVCEPQFGNMGLDYVSLRKKKKKLGAFSPQASYTDRAIAAGQRS